MHVSFNMFSVVVVHSGATNMAAVRFSVWCEWVMQASVLCNQPPPQQHKHTHTFNRHADVRLFGAMASLYVHVYHMYICNVCCMSFVYARVKATPCRWFFNADMVPRTFCDDVPSFRSFVQSSSYGAYYYSIVPNNEWKRALICDLWDFHEITCPKNMKECSIFKSVCVWWFIH